MYISKGISYIIMSMPIAVMIYLILLGVFWLKKMRKISYKRTIVEFFFIWYIVSILNITGMLELTFNIEWFLNSVNNFNFCFFEHTSLKMLLLNFTLFVPMGIFLPIVIKKIKWSFFKVFFIALVVSCTIELLQMFSGRLSEVDDVLMNSSGAVAGYLVYEICRKVIVRQRHGAAEKNS